MCAAVCQYLQRKHCRDVITGKPKSAADSKVIDTKLLDLRVLSSDDVGLVLGQTGCYCAERFCMVVCMANALFLLLSSRL